DHLSAVSGGQDPSAGGQRNRHQSGTGKSSGKKCSLPYSGTNFLLLTKRSTPLCLRGASLYLVLGRLCGSFGRFLLPLHVADQVSDIAGIGQFHLAKAECALKSFMVFVQDSGDAQIVCCLCILIVV